MIITDGVHLTSTIGEDELHKFARGMGLKREWYQDKNRTEHYDLTTKRAARRAIKNGAKLVTGREMVLLSWWTVFPRITAGSAGK